MNSTETDQAVAWAQTTLVELIRYYERGKHPELVSDLQAVLTALNLQRVELAEYRKASGRKSTVDQLKANRLRLRGLLAAIRGAR